MNIAMAALRKNKRIMQTPEEDRKVSQQVFWNKKIQSEARSQRHYATVSRHLKRRANWKWVITRPTQTACCSLKTTFDITCDKVQPNIPCIAAITVAVVPVPW